MSARRSDTRFLQHAVTAVLAACALAALVLWTKRAPQKPVDAPASAVSEQVAPKATSAPLDLDAPAMTPAAPAPAMTPAAAPPAPAPADRDVVFADLKAIYTKSPELHQFKVLQGKVLTSREDRQKLAALLSDPAHIKKAGDVLLDGSPTAFTPEATMERMYRIEFLMTAASYEDNPQKELVLATLKKAIATPRLSTDAPESARRAWAGDRVELYYVLSSYFPPAEAVELRRNVDDPKLAKLLAYADQNRTRLGRLFK